MELLRVFPRRTNATPDDGMAFIGDPGLFRPEADEVHISVTFTYDKVEGLRLQKAWQEFYPVVRIGGPGMGDRGEDFEPGRYLKKGYVITSRGCPNRCWYCYVWKRDGDIRELPITEGWKVQDDNLLACSDSHITAVFDMLSRQRKRPEFTAGLDASRITPEIAGELARIKTATVFVSNDGRPDDLEIIRQAAQNLEAVGFNRNKLRSFVLIGYPEDTLLDAETRLRETWDAGYLPFAMLYRDDSGEYDRSWRQFQRLWARPAATKAICKQTTKEVTT